MASESQLLLNPTEHRFHNVPALGELGPFVRVPEFVALALQGGMVFAQFDFAPLGILAALGAHRAIRAAATITTQMLLLQVRVTLLQP